MVLGFSWLSRCMPKSETALAIPEEWFYIDSEMTMKLDFDPDSFLTHLQRFRSDNFWNRK